MIRDRHVTDPSKMPITARLQPQRRFRRRHGLVNRERMRCSFSFLSIPTALAAPPAPVPLAVTYAGILPFKQQQMRSSFFFFRFFQSPGSPAGSDAPRRNLRRKTPV